MFLIIRWFIYNDCRSEQHLCAAARSLIFCALFIFAFYKCFAVLSCENFQFFSRKTVICANVFFVYRRSLLHSVMTSFPCPFCLYVCYEAHFFYFSMNDNFFTAQVLNSSFVCLFFNFIPFRNWIFPEISTTVFHLCVCMCDMCRQFFGYS